MLRPSLIQALQPKLGLVIESIAVSVLGDPELRTAAETLANATSVYFTAIVPDGFRDLAKGDRPEADALDEATIRFRTVFLESPLRA